VRTFNSGKSDKPGTLGASLGRTPLMRNGTTPIHALPSNSSRANAGGMSGRNTAAGTRQCANSKSSHIMCMTNGVGGAG